MPCKMSMHDAAAQLAFSLCGLLVASSSRPLTFMVTAYLTRSLSVALARPPDSTKASLGSSTFVCVIARSNTSSVYDGLQALCFSAQLIIILLIGGIFAIPAACHCRRFVAPARATIPLTFLQACSVIALASALASSQGFSASLPGLLRSCALRASRSLKSAF